MLRASMQNKLSTIKHNAFMFATHSPNKHVLTLLAIDNGNQATCKRPLKMSHFSQQTFILIDLWRNTHTTHFPVPTLVHFIAITVRALLTFYQKLFVSHPE